MIRPSDTYKISPSLSVVVIKNAALLATTSQDCALWEMAAMIPSRSGKTWVEVQDGARVLTRMGSFAALMDRWIERPKPRTPALAAALGLLACFSILANWEKGNYLTIIGCSQRL